MNGKSYTFLVSFDYTHGDIPVLIIGRKGEKKEIDIINAFKGDEAKDLYDLLMDGKEKYEATKHEEREKAEAAK